MRRRTAPVNFQIVLDNNCFNCIERRKNCAARHFERLSVFPQDLSKYFSTPHLVLVLGGCGFIGRNFVKFLVDNKLATKIVVADKSPPFMGFFNDEHKAVFEQKEVVEFKQADVSKDGRCCRLVY